jgi:hypothetical protein
LSQFILCNLWQLADAVTLQAGVQGRTD